MTYAVLPDHVVSAWAELSPAAKAVVVCLAVHMNGQGECWPGRERIMQRSGIRTPYTVSKATKELQEKGLLTVRRRVRQSCVYEWADSEGQGKQPSESPEGEPNRLSAASEGRPDRSREGEPGRPLNNTTLSTENTKYSPGGTKSASTPVELRGLELYEGDVKLRRRWPSLLKAWGRAHPGVDIGAEVARAHAWEVANSTRRKKDKARFLGGWLSRVKVDSSLANTEPPPLLPEVVDALEAHAARTT